MIRVRTKARRRAVLLGGVIGVLALVVVAVWWPRAPKEREVRLSGRSAGHQEEPAVARLSDNSMLVTWVSAATPGGAADVMAARLGAGGKVLWPEFRVSEVRESPKKAPLVLAFRDRRSVVLWHSLARDGSGWGVFGRFLDADGKSLRQAFLVNEEDREGDQTQAAAAAWDDNRFVVVWVSRDSRGRERLQVQLFDQRGLRVGRNLTLSPDVTEKYRHPSVVCISGGGFVFAWEGRSIGRDYGIFMRQVDAGGAPVGPVVEVAGQPGQRLRRPSLLLHGEGRVLVAWTAEIDEGASSSVEARIVDLTSGKPGPVVPLVRGGDPWGQRLVRLGNEGFAVFWNMAASDQPDQGVYGLEFDGYRRLRTHPLRVHVRELGDQRLGGAVRLDGGRVGLAWQSHGQDGDGWGVYARILELRSP